MLLLVFLPSDRLAILQSHRLIIGSVPSSRRKRLNFASNPFPRHEDRQKESLEAIFVHYVLDMR